MNQFVSTLKKHRLLILILLLASLLRLTNLGSNPPELYWDEASLGYNAFAIATRGVDEHGVRFPVTHFLAYGDAKPPIYVYASSLSILAFGATPFAVRLPSALAGIFAVFITYLLSHYLLKPDKPSKTLKKYLGSNYHQLIPALLLAISPWHIQMSRAAFEANLALTFFLAGLLFFFQAQTKPKRFLLSGIFFVATLYTFNSYRLFLPPFLLTLFLLYFKQNQKHLKWILATVALSSILIAPLIPFVLSDQAKLRFNEVTIFKNHQPVIDANQRIELNNNAFWAKLLHNRRLLFAGEFLKHYTDQFKPDFLFITGDVNPRLSTRDQGGLYGFEIILVLLGVYALLKSSNPHKSLIISWLLLAFIPAGVARETPHALRSLQVLPIPQLLVALGIFHFAKHHKKLLLLLPAVYLGFFVTYLDTYHLHYREHWAAAWQSGYSQLVDYIKQNGDQYHKIYISERLGRPHTYLLFYLRYDPVEYVANRDAGGDAFGFTYTKSFDKYYFGDHPHLDTKPEQESWLLVTGPDGVPTRANQLHVIHDLTGQAILSISEYR